MIHFWEKLDSMSGIDKLIFCLGTIVLCFILFVAALLLLAAVLWIYDEAAYAIQEWREGRK